VPPIFVQVFFHLGFRFLMSVCTILVNNSAEK